MRERKLVFCGMHWTPGVFGPTWTKPLSWQLAPGPFAGSLRLTDACVAGTISCSICS
jgi:hypothetical protein